jgi:hypothetical protein
MDASLLNVGLLARRMGESSGGGGMGMFLVLVIIGIVVFLMLRGRQDRAEALGTPARALPSGSVQGHVFANPFPKCPACGAAGDKMRQSWDGLRKVTWSCGYCGSVAGIQELKDEELPAGARQRLGLDAPQGMVPGQPGYFPPQGGGGGLITGMILGSMLGGERRYRDDDGGWRGGGEGPTSSNDWGENDNSGGGGDGGGGDWGDSGGGDSGGSSDF